jgi:transmembrane sensor
MQTPQSGTEFAITGWAEGGNAESGRSTEYISLSRRRFIRNGLTIAAAAAIGSALWSQVTQRRFSTKIGELGHAELPDGSMAILNTATEIAVRFTGQARLVQVLKGEVLFDVAPDAHRVFIAEAGSFQVQAPPTSSGAPRKHAARIGSLVDYARDVAVPLTKRSSHTLFATRGSTFTIRRRPDQTVELVVLEGTTEIAHRARDWRRINEDTVVQATDHADAQTSFELRSVNTLELAAKVAWLDRHVVFAGNHTLRDAAAEFNRYNKVHILFEGRTGDRQIRGSFHVDQPNAFVQSIEVVTRAKHRVISDHLIVIEDPDATATLIKERQ